MQDPQPTRIFLVDDHTLFRESLRRLLETETRYVVTAEVSSVEAAVELCRSKAPFDLALIDYDLGPSSFTQGGIEVLRCLREHRKDVPVLMITAGVHPKDLTVVVHELHAGVFLKADPSAELLLALKKTLRGEVWLSSGVALSLLSNPPAEHTEDGRVVIDARERDVLALVVEGLSNKEIGTKLRLSESGVKAILQRLFQKIGVRTRAQLVRFAFESELDLS